MTRLLTLDWEQDRCHILAGTLTKGAVQIDRTLEWPEPELLSPDRAEELGKKLRDFLKDAGLLSAPVLACVGRERVLLKEIRYPVVAAQEEPALVHFQAAKEMLESPEDSVLDYARLSEANGERRALVAVLRREILVAYMTMCRVAGLKLLALAPRPFAMPGCLVHGQQAGKIPAGTALATDVSAVLWIGPARAELTILRGGTVLFARSLEMETLVADLRRSLVVFAQASAAAPTALYLVGHDVAQELRGLLHKAANAPVFALSPKQAAPNSGEDRFGSFATGVGLLQAWTREQVPINFARPKEPKVAAPRDRSRLVVTGGLAFLVFLGTVFFGMLRINDLRAQIQEKVGAKATIEADIKKMAQDQVDLEALKEWDRGNISWLDEFYDLTARMPNQVGFHMNKLQAEPLSHKAKDKFVARLNLTGVTPEGKDNLVYQYLDTFGDQHLQARIERFKGGNSQEFSLKVDLAPIGPKRYQTRLAPTTAPPRTGKKGPRAQAPFNGQPQAFASPSVFKEADDE